MRLRVQAGVPVSQLSEVMAIVRDGGWRTLRALAAHHGNIPESSLSARLRDLRALGYIVERRRAHLPGGIRAKVFEYRVRAGARGSRR
jgi:hypothetical protein